MKCQQCGHNNEPEFRFCENCGTVLPRKKIKKEGDELHIPSIFEKPVEYTGRYSDSYYPSRRVRKKAKKQIAYLAVAVGLLLIYWVASQFSRENSEMPPIIQEYANAVRAGNTEKLEEILISATTGQLVNPDSIPGFLRVMEIPGRLNESVRNLEVDLSHIKENPKYVSNMPVKLILLGKEYKVAVDTFHVDVRSTGATIDGISTGADGIFRDYLMGQYFIEYGENRFPILLDSTNPNLEDGTITPSQLASEESPTKEQSEALKPPKTGGEHAIILKTSAENARLRIDGQDTELTVSGLPDKTIRLDSGQTLQLIEIWAGGIGVSEAITIEKSETVEFSMRYDSQETKNLIYSRIQAMFAEDKLMLTEKRKDFTTMVDPALADAKENVDKLIRGNQNYAGTYDRVEFDPESFRLEKTDAGATAHVLGLLTYVYQTSDMDKPPLNVDDLYRDTTVIAFDLVLDLEKSQWMIKDWGRTEESLSQAPRTVVELK